MKKAISLVAVTAALVAPAAAEGIAIDTSIAFESKYVFRGVQFAESSIQPGIDLSYGDFYVGSWMNLPVGDDDGVATPGGEEVDLYGGYSTSLDDTWSVDVGVTYYMFPDLASGFGDLNNNSLEAYIGVSADVLFGPSLYVYRDFQLDATTIQGSAGYSFPLSDKTSFDLGGTLGYVIDDDAGDPDFVYGAATADLSYAVSESGSVFFGGRFSGTDIPGGGIWDGNQTGPTITTTSSGFWFGLGFSSSL